MEAATLVYPRRAKNSNVCSELVSFLLRCVSICIGTINVWLVITDKQRLLATRGYEGISDSGYDVVMITNLFLIVGSVLDWYILVAFWILVYAFIIIYCSAKFVITSAFPWTPGISYTAAVLIMDKFDFASGLKPMVAIMYTLVNFLIVFLVFLVTAVLDFKKNLEARAAASSELPVALARMAASGGGRSSGSERSGGGVGLYSDGGLPTYSEIAGDGSSSSALPPPYTLTPGKREKVVKA